MKLFAFLTYVVVEIGAFIGLVYGIGFWWTVVATAAAFVIGLILLRRQGARVFTEVRAAAEGRTDSLRPITDTALLAVAVFLLFIPGLVSTVLGIVLMLRPTRAVLRPVVTRVGAARIATTVGRFTPASGWGTVVEGEVVDADGHRPGVYGITRDPRV
ncbi:FxsA family protein [Williamsia sp. CHRR-6]|uniref:FxsA family protein n=1 Tax=Williamsia sp. CHRR-6 TaxID=2835871 RepID=UPI001BDB0543|nr:FxsA family protein [Williamsia sp. CHRR-6]MBT0568134.1 FxsA family protein [Williamsia sp. CHRR-6]